MFLPTQTFLNNFSLSKKQKFLFTALLFAFAQALGYFLGRDWQILPIAFAFLGSFFFVKVLFSTDFDFYWLSLSLFPAFLSLSIGLANYYYPNTVLWFKIGFIFFYFLAYYLLLLALNIFNVSASREESIPLLSAAKTVLFLIVTVVAFFLFTVVLKGLGYFLLQLIFVVGFSFLLSFFLFTLNRGGERDNRVFLGAGLISFVCFQVFLAFAFIPVETFFRGLIIAAAFYVGISLMRDYFAHKINSRLVLEYFFLLIILGAVVFRFSME